MFRRTLLYPTLLGALLMPVASFAAMLSSTPISPDGSSFAVQGTGLDGVAGIDVTINYDSTLLSNPRVDLSGGLLAGMMTQQNTGVLGSIRLVGVGSNAIRGTGLIAKIVFNKTSDAPGKIMALSGHIVDGNGRYMPLSAPSITNPPDASSSSTPALTENSGSNSNSSGSIGSGSSGSGTNGPTASTSTTPTASYQGGGYIVGGTVTMPGDETANRKEAPAAAPTPDRDAMAAAAAAAAAAIPMNNPVSPPAADTLEPTREQASAPQSSPDQKRAEAPTKSAPSVLERFRIFDGERTPKNQMALFDRNDVANFKQDPPVVISDGVSTVKVTISKLSGEKTPNFVFNSARYVSLAQVGDGEWLVEAKPERGTFQASISMFLDGKVQEYPLAVAPPAHVDLIKPGSATEADFALFLKDRGTDAAPKFDLNGDRKRDYLDDYIFTANYLVQVQQSASQKPTAAK